MGFFIAVFPWVIGAGIFLFLKHDYRERTGLMACAIAVSALLTYLCILSMELAFEAGNFCV
jgi:hypothetical protein